MENSMKSGRVIVPQENKQMLIFKSKAGLGAVIESHGFDIDEIQAAMNLSAEKHKGISWDLIPPGLPV